VLKAFEFGADAVLFATCPQERDPFPETRDKVERCIMHASAVAGALGLESERLVMCPMPLIEPAVIDELIQKIKEMGPNPLQA
ncbi:MAG: hydrogenase iron-sulfur subunit, partial [Deltaproteobacteria bacterium]|nr:hydrogenase iron-sulfur subunit [Deltaproteobacteria bacterium]